MGEHWEQMGGAAVTLDVAARERPEAAPSLSWRDGLLACAALRDADAPCRSRKDALLAYLSPREGQRSATRLGHLDKPAWDMLVEYVLRASVRLGPPLYARLQADELTGHVPDEPCARLRAAFARAQQQHVRRCADLAEILEVFQREGVPVAVLKGAYLAEHVYPDPAARTMRDLDLLVSRRDLAHAERMLLDLEYGPEAPWRPSIEWTCNTSNTLPPLWRDGGPGVDLHWTLTDPRSPFTIDIDQVWQRMTPTRLAGRSALALSAEDCLLHLCEHAACRHGFEVPLRCYYDIALLVHQHRQSLDWNRLLSRAHEWHASQLVFAALSVASLVFDAEVPHDVLVGLSGRRLDWYVARVVTDHGVRAAPARSAEGRTTLRVVNAWLRDVTVRDAVGTGPSA